jgi:hypothetical protein
VNTQAANAVIRTVEAVGMRYADSRRDSLVLLPEWSSPIPIAVSDIENVLNPIYESLKNICEDAATQPSEAAVMGCLRALGEMAVHALTIVHTVHGGRTVPLAYSPVFYMDVCTKRAATVGMDDALLTVITSIGEIVAAMSAEVDTRMVESTAVK